jgi:hypothetical protein
VCAYSRVCLQTYLRMHRGTATGALHTHTVFTHMLSSHTYCLHTHTVFTLIQSSHTYCLHTHTVFTHIHPHPLLTPTPAPTYIHIHTRTPYLHMHTTTGTYRQAQPPRWLMLQAEDRDSYSLCLSLQTPRAMHTDTYRQLDGMHTGSYRQLHVRPPKKRACHHVLMHAV